MPYNPSMSIHLTNLEDSIHSTIEKAIVDAIEDAKVAVKGGGGHFTIEVQSTQFEGKNMLQSQRLVYSAIAHLMDGNNAPVHAVDSLITKTP